MKHLAISLLYIGFYSMIGFAVYYTGSLWALWALLLTPDWESTEDNITN